MIDLPSLALDAGHQYSLGALPALFPLHQGLQLAQLEEASRQQQIGELDQYSLLRELGYSQQYSDDLVVNEVYLQAVEIEA